MKVSYDKAMKDKAKAQDKSLYTISTTWPGGKHSMTYQGYATEEMLVKLYAVCEELRVMAKAAFSQQPPTQET